MTIVYDLQRGRVVWVGRDRTRETMDHVLRWLGSRRAHAIQTVCSDMASAYGDAIRQHLPDATHVIDRFHVSQQICRQTWRTLAGCQRGEFNHTRLIEARCTGVHPRR